ncbi:MAG: 3-deoxy-manno-octulosonate cytidylyltransferase [Bacteroidales bacterium]|nr:3-deoxy-manno-octulosonate cytidylyltransferase [Bacteroidales bacterium]
MKIVAIIPARYASSRFPGKPLVNIAGKSMIQRVYEQTSLVFDRVYVATDDERIYTHLCNLSYNVVLTANSHQSGTDRIAEAIDIITKNEHQSFEIVVNVQGDEPFIQPEQLKKVVQPFYNSETQISTLIKKITTEEELFDINKPKVVVDNFGKAIYFSRHPIPFLRNSEKKFWHLQHNYYKHIGLYAYKTEILKQITALSPSKLELAESLEQLRWIQNGYMITVVETDIETISIDTPDDLSKINELNI